MRSQSLGMLVALVAPIVISACSSQAENADFVRCRAAAMKAFNIVFADAVTDATLRWVHACMENKGYKRLYDSGRCQKLEASMEEPQCYVPI